MTRILVFCDEPSHERRVASVERFHQVADAHWVPDARKGAHGPGDRRVDHFSGPTSLSFQAGRRNAMLRCPLCGLDLQRAMTAIEPIFNELADAGVERVSLRALVRLTC